MAIRAIDSSTPSCGHVYPTTMAIAPLISSIKPKTVNTRQTQSPVRCAGGGGKRYLSKVNLKVLKTLKQSYFSTNF